MFAVIIFAYANINLNFVVTTAKTICIVNRVYNGTKFYKTNPYRKISMYPVYICMYLWYGYDECIIT